MSEQKKVHVGDKIEWENISDGQTIKGIVGEVVPDSVEFFAWHNYENDFHGSKGNLSPVKNGYKYSYLMGTDFFDMYNGKVLGSASAGVPAKDAKKMSLLKLHLTRNNMKVKIDFEVDQKLTDIFKENSAEIKESASWVGLKFYSVPSIVSSAGYKALLNNYSLFDDFGTSLHKDGKFNIAWTRTVGGKGTIEVKDNFLTEEELKRFLRNSVSFLRDYYEESLKDIEIFAELTMVI